MPESGFHITSVLSIIVAVLSLAVSSLTAWLTLLRKGHILMTQPTVIYFGPDGGFHATAVVEPVPRLARKEPASNNQTITIERRTAPIKVYLRTLLYSTGKKGHVIENMFVRLHRGETQQNFNIWTYGDKDLYRGSGLFVPETGVASNHHFLLPPDGTNFQFSSGRYTLDIFATEVGVHNSCFSK